MDCFRLPHLTEVEIRPIRADDRLRLQAAHARLSAETQYKRFHVAKPHLSSADARYLVEVDGSDHFALVATLSDDPELIVGVARFVRLPEAPQAAEFAIVVGDRFQRQGLGTEMLRHLAAAARRRGILRFRATMLASNDAARRLVRSLGAASADERPRGQIAEIEIALAPRLDRTRAAAPAMIAGCPGG